MLQGELQTDDDFNIGSCRSSHSAKPTCAILIPLATSDWPPNLLPCSAPMILPISCVRDASSSALQREKRINKFNVNTHATLNERGKMAIHICRDQPLSRHRDQANSTFRIRVRFYVKHDVDCVRLGVPPCRHVVPVPHPLRIVDAGRQ